MVSVLRLECGHTGGLVVFVSIEDDGDGLRGRFCGSNRKPTITLRVSAMRSYLPENPRGSALFWAWGKLVEHFPHPAQEAARPGVHDDCDLMSW